MFEANQILEIFLLFLPRSLENSKKDLFTFYF